MAAHHACETGLAHPLYRDPHARALAGEDGWSLMGAMRQTEWPGYGATGPHPWISITTKFFDDALQRVVNDFGIRQVVMLGGGMDTRAFRLRWPAGLTLFEVDRPELFEHKEPVLERLGARSACRCQTVAADPQGSWTRALIRRGLDATRPTAFLSNGLEYLSTASADHLMRQITTVAATGSWVGFAVTSDETRRSPFFTPFIARQQRLGLPAWSFGLDDPDAWLAAYGWTATTIVGGAPEANYGRWPLRYVPRETPAIPRTFLTQGWRGSEETTCGFQ